VNGKLAVRPVQPSTAQLTGIGGWLALLAVALSAGLLRDSVEFFGGFLPTMSDQWKYPALRVRNTMVN